MRVTKKIFTILFVCCLVAPISAFAIDASEVTEEDITTTVQTLVELGITQDPIIDPNNCGSMGQTKIDECKEVPKDQDCPQDFCEIGGGGGKKRCAKWTACSQSSCTSAHGKGSVCIEDTMLNCACFCYEKSLADTDERYQACGGGPIDFTE